MKLGYNSNRFFKYNQSIKIDEQNITIVTEVNKNVFKKEDIRKIIYDIDSVYILIGYRTFLIIKKRFLDNDNEYHKLIEFIKIKYKNE